VRRSGQDLSATLVILVFRVSNRRLDIFVTDRASIEQGFLVRSAYALISIRDPDKRKVRARRSPLLKATLELAFHDAEPRTAFKLPENIRLINEEDAAQIWQFVRALSVEVKTVVVHCEQGMSRSPAVAAALCRGLGQDPARFMTKYQPNAYVLRLITEAAGSLGSQRS